MGAVGVSVSAWSADLGALRADLMAAEPYCDSFHFDIMDGHFAPNLLFGPDHLRALRAGLTRPFEGHFMIRQADAICPLFYDVCDGFLLHRRSVDDWIALRDKLRARGKRIGLAVCVDEDWRDLADDLPDIDVVLVMGTAIGTKGVDLHPHVVDAVRELREHVDARELSTTIQVDGGLRDHTVPALVAAGAHVVTAGSLFFESDYPAFQPWLDRCAATGDPAVPV
jgi:ribulose-phosphate 3-epimerase